MRVLIVAISVLSLFEPKLVRLALALFVTGVAADHHDAAVAADDFAVVTNLFYGGVDLHEVSF